MTKFNNRYRIESNRLKSWDYGSNTLYFVTVCCKNRVCFFGTISDKKMIVSEEGKIAENFWLEIPKHFSFAILHNHVIMPNHMHAVIEINKTNTDNAQETTIDVSTKRNISPRTKNASLKWKPGILGVIINQYKRICTINIRKMNPDFGWQANYHEHIIRDQRAYNNIFNYITNNPLKWKEDTFR